MLVVITKILLVAIFLSYVQVPSVVCSESSESNQFVDVNKFLMQLAPTYGILAMTIKNSKNFPKLSTQCTKQARDVLQAVNRREYWALKLLDASGFIKSNLMYGNRFMLGSRTECERVNFEMNYSFRNIRNVHLLNATSPFRIQYAILYADLRTDMQYNSIEVIFSQTSYHIGICIPTSCTERDIQSLAIAYYSKDFVSVEWSRLYNATIQIISVKLPSIQNVFKRADFIGILSALFIFICTVFALNWFQLNLHKNKNLQRISLCFSLTKNFQSLISIKNSNGFVQLDAIRTLACFLIFSGHVLHFTTILSSHGTEVLLASYNKLSTQIFLFNIIYVDVFFVVSGVLLTHNFLRNDQQLSLIMRNGICDNFKLFSKLLIRRYIRLTPPLIITMCLTQLTGIYLMENSFFPRFAQTDYRCDFNSWWRSLIYIQGHFHWKTMCGSWTWYLSSDMHFYIIILLILFCYSKHPIIGKCCFLLLLLSSLGYTLIKNIRCNYTLQIDRGYELADELYINPFVRMNPYLAGVVGGYILNKFKNLTHRLKTCLWGVFVVSAATILITTVAAVNNAENFPILSQIFNSIGRFIFGIAIASFALLLCYGQGGHLSTFMSKRMFIHFNKLSYLFYLISPIVISFAKGSKDNPTKDDIFDIYVELIGYGLICYTLAFILALFFEIPFARLSNEFFVTNKIKQKL